MELKSYSKFHIGIKVKSGVDLNEFKSSLKDFAASKEYTLVGAEQVDITKILSKGFTPGIEKIAEKGDSEIHFNSSAGAINFVGKDPSEISNLFKEGLEFLEGNGYELNTIVEFFEIITEVVFENTQPPTEVLKNKISFDTTKLLEMGEADVDLIKIKNRGNNTGDYLEITMGVNPLKPSKEFIVVIVKRSIDIDKIYNFHTIIKETMESFIN